MGIKSMGKLRQFDKKIQLPAEPGSHQPEIRWPYRDGGLECFPDYDDLYINYSPLYTDSTFCTSVVLSDFYEALIGASKRVWIIDKNFLQDKYSLDGEIHIGPSFLQNAIVQSSFPELKIITLKPKDINRIDPKTEERELINLRKKFRPRDGLLVVIRILNKRSSKIIHDRFAIIDNSLWHFGSDVGGRDPKLNAVSFGWDAIRTGAISFFEKLWNRS